MTDSTENATPPKSSKSRNSTSSVQIQIKPKSQLEIVPRDTEEPEFLNSVDFRDLTFSVQTVRVVIPCLEITSHHTLIQSLRYTAISCVLASLHYTFSSCVLESFRHTFSSCALDFFALW